MCQKAQYADITKRKASELREMKREHPEHFSREKLLDVCGHVEECDG